MHLLCPKETGLKPKERPRSDARPCQCWSWSHPGREGDAVERGQGRGVAAAGASPPRLPWAGQPLASPTLSARGPEAAGRGAPGRGCARACLPLTCSRLQCCGACTRSGEPAHRAGSAQEQMLRLKANPGRREFPPDPGVRARTRTWDSAWEVRASRAGAARGLRSPSIPCTRSGTTAHLL